MTQMRVVGASQAVIQAIEIYRRFNRACRYLPPALSFLFDERRRLLASYSFTIVRTCNLCNRAGRNPFLVGKLPVWRAGVHDATAQAAIQSGRLSLIMLATMIIGLASIPPNAHAACIITTTGTVDCTTNTTTSDSSNIDGADSISSARRQRFNNGSAITGAIQFGVTVNGYGLQLDEAGPRSSAPITVNNEGQVAATKNFNSLQLNGNGASVSYFRRW